MTSALSVKRQMPDIQRILITPDRNILGIRATYDKIVNVPEVNTGYWFLDSLHYLVEGAKQIERYSRIMFLDADTYICEPVPELFNMLSKFNIIAAHAPARFTTDNVNNLSSAFPEVNVGVFLFHACDDDFLLAWRDQFEKHREIYKNNDQGPLRDIIWQTLYDNEKFRYHIIPPEYNCRFNFPCFLATDPKILHGRSEDYEKTLAKIKALGRRMRSWKQGEVNYP
jgi:hypothetical protein